MEEGEQLIGPKFKLKEHILFVIQTLVPNLVKTTISVSGQTPYVGFGNFSQLRRHTVYRIPRTKTNKYRSFIHFALAKYQ